MNTAIPSPADSDTVIATFRDDVRCAVGLTGGKWKLEILWVLNQRMHRFNELRRAIPDVTQHMLTAQLRQLEADGFVSRTVYAEVPPRVEYEITDEARQLRPVFDAVFAWASERSLRKQTA
ncbi:MarR family transcriptional regulator [Paraburkholderia phytofirmans OLGA172]|uniref:MarR family transcriptional regulator n=1 Tax=Paraburkholderia phytofirmans OLGA172 TaxID=1417228 RepID=A0A160FQ27_9BURK|nr:helix-turn-helix domain-containing protein [Paraburkholderia phytofirmans]ANB74596.1 MarR family transcriptional regulator [Paraburkholderia phytofirmans OLGA172]